MKQHWIYGVYVAQARQQARHRRGSRRGRCMETHTHITHTNTNGCLPRPSHPLPREQSREQGIIEAPPLKTHTHHTRTQESPRTACVAPGYPTSVGQGPGTTTSVTRCVAPGYPTSSGQGPGKTISVTRCVAPGYPTSPGQGPGTTTSVTRFVAPGCPTSYIHTAHLPCVLYSTCNMNGYNAFIYI